MNQPLYRRVQDELIRAIPRAVAPADQPYIRLNFAALEVQEIERRIATLGARSRAAIEEEDLT